MMKDERIAVKVLILWAVVVWGCLFTFPVTSTLSVIKLKQNTPKDMTGFIMKHPQSLIISLAFKLNMEKKSYR